MTGAATPDTPAGGFVVSDNVSFTAGGDRTKLPNLTADSEVRIGRTDPGTFAVETESSTPLSEADRELARRIARDNRTVSRALGRMDAPELTVEPVKPQTAEFEVDQVRTAENSATVSVDGREHGTTYVISVSTASDEVLVDREPQYVRDMAHVKASSPGDGGTGYHVTVDVANVTTLGGFG